jgi:imidazolonepropionase-like amidohydrolase
LKPTRCVTTVFALSIAAVISLTDRRMPAADPELVPAPPRITALIGAMIRTQTDAGDFVGTIVIEDGKITAIGPAVRAPANAVRIDVSHCVITPGLIDARSVMWLTSSAAKETGSTGNLNILDGVDPFAEDWHEAARQGVTAVYLQPGSGGRCGGSGAVLRVGPGTSTESLVIRGTAGVQATLGVPAAPVPQQDDQLSMLAARFGFQIPNQQDQAPPASNSLTRFTQFEAFRGLFDAAKRYGNSKPSEHDAGKELLSLALKREIPVRLETAHEDDLRNLLKLGSEFGLRTVFERLDRVKPLPEEMSARKDALIVGPFEGGKKSADVRRLALDGRKFALGTYGDDPKATALIRVHAAVAVADGYPRARLLRALTRDAAEIHGVADHLGSLAVGRLADLAIYAGEPLDPSTQVRMTICQGVVTYDNSAVEQTPETIVAKPVVPDALPPSFVLKTTHLLTDAGEWAPGELFVTGGRVSDRSAGSNGASVLDVGDAPVTPGLVSARVSFCGESCPDADAGHLRAGDALPPDHGPLRSLRDAGFTGAIVVPGSANVIGGTATQVLSGETGGTAAGVQFVLASTARKTERYPASLVGQIELIGDRLRGGPSKTQLCLPAAVSKTLLAQRDEGLAAVRAGRSAAYFEAHTRAEIRAALRLIGEFKLRGVIVEPQQLDDVADEIRAAGAAVVVGPARPHDGEKARERLAELAKRGVSIAFGGDANEIRAAAAMLVNAGMPRPAARLAMIGQPADRFGLTAGTGRLSLGDRADFVIWDGDPLDPAARPAAVVIRGQRAGRGS